MTPPAQPQPARGPSPERPLTVVPELRWVEKEGAVKERSAAEGVLRASKAAGARVIWALVALGAVVVLGMAVWRYGPPDVTVAAHADSTRIALVEAAIAAQAKASERQEAVIANATVALNANTAALAELRGLIRDLPERVRALEVRAGGK